MSSLSPPTKKTPSPSSRPCRFRRRLSGGSGSSRRIPGVSVVNNRRVRLSSSSLSSSSLSSSYLLLLVMMVAVGMMTVMETILMTSNNNMIGVGHNLQLQLQSSSPLSGSRPINIAHAFCIPLHTSPSSSSSARTRRRTSPPSSGSSTVAGTAAAASTKSTTHLFLSSSSSTSSSDNDTASTVQSVDDNAEEAEIEETPMGMTNKKIPVTVLSGFLGSGKTTLLQHLLQNRQGLKVGVVVNDVASVNVDAKLVKQSQSQSQSPSDIASAAPAAVPDGLIELQNGCACCSLGDELLMSVSQLVTLSDLKQDPEDKFQHIVIEVSGVGDPKAIRAQFQDAAYAGMPLMDRVQLDTMVTVVDASMWKSYFESTKRATRSEMPELYGDSSSNSNSGDGGDKEKTIEDFDADDVPLPKDGSTKEEWMDDMPPELLKAVMNALNGESQDGQEEATNGVTDLLISQVETSDIIVLNKCDLVAPGDQTEEDDIRQQQQQQQDQLEEILRVFNPRASVLPTSFGKIPLMDVLGASHGEGVALSGQVDDHRDFVEAAMPSSSISTSNKSDLGHDHDHESHDDHDSRSQHDHEHDHAEETSSSATTAATCTDPDCTDPSHNHDHTTTQHSHSHSHSHSHNHDSSSDSDSSCSDPTCTDPTHSHVHSHAHDDDDDNSKNTPHAGIGTFVYRARRPFHPRRLYDFLNKLPIARGMPTLESNDEGVVEEDNADTEKDDDKTLDTLSSCLRSKGFCWIADSHASAMYWSHAGRSFELSCLGQWWATLPRDQWPDGVEEYVLSDYDDKDHVDGDGGGTGKDTVGDRRQEVVFIGPGYFSSERQRHIQLALDRCLLSPEEYDEYQKLQDDEQELNVRFRNIMESKYANF